MSGSVARPRRGFTVVELLVAVTLITVGALAMASTSAAVMRNLTAGAQQTVAATLAQSRFEALRGAPCDKIESNETNSRGMSERWKVVRQTRSVSVVVTLTYSDGRSPRMVEYRTVIPCPALQGPAPLVRAVGRASRS